MAPLGAFLILLGSVNDLLASPPISLEQLRARLRQNEASIVSYQGRMTHTQQVYVAYALGNGFEPPTREPRLFHTVEAEFIRDRSRGEDHYIHMRHESPFHEFEEPYVTERRNGSMIESLISDRSGQPTLGIIAPTSQARYVGNAPANLVALHHTYILSSAYEDGYEQTPVSELLSDPSRIFLYPQTERIGDHECVRVAVTAPHGNSSRLTYLWLGGGVGLSVVRQQTMFIPKEEGDLSRWQEILVERGIDFTVEQALEDRLNRAVPSMLYSHEDFREVAPDVWIPARTRSYMFSAPNPKRYAESVSEEQYLQIAQLNPETAHLTRAIVRGYHEFVLDMDSLRINEVIDPAVFETPLTPQGVPISNFITGSHPLDVQSVTDERISELGDAVARAAAAQFEGAGGEGAARDVEPDAEAGFAPSVATAAAHGLIRVVWLIAGLTALLLAIVVAWALRRGRSSAPDEG